MKTPRPTHLTAVVFSLSVLAAAGYAERELFAETPRIAPQVAATTKAAESNPIAADQVAAKTASDATATTWSDIKDIAYDQRVQFFAGLKIVQSKVDAQIAELIARRRAMTSKTDTKDWDFAMKEMVESRAYLQSTGEALAKAMPETWMQEKDKVGQAWERTQAAYTRVKSSTTG